VDWRKAPVVIIRQYPASLDQLYTLFSLNFGEQSSPSVVINNIVALLNCSTLNETIQKEVRYDEAVEYHRMLKSYKTSGRSIWKIGNLDTWIAQKFPDTENLSFDSTRLNGLRFFFKRNDLLLIYYVSHISFL
jgi:hypothetical protein